MTAEAEAGGPARSRRRPRSRGWGRGRRDRPSRRTCLVSGRTPREPPRPVPRGLGRRGRRAESRAPNRARRRPRAATVNRDDGSDEISDEDASSEPPTYVTFRAEPTSCFEASKAPDALPRRAGSATARRRRFRANDRVAAIRLVFPRVPRRARRRRERVAPRARREESRRAETEASSGALVAVTRVRRETFTRFRRVCALRDAFASSDVFRLRVERLGFTRRRFVPALRFSSPARDWRDGPATAGPVPAPLGNTGCLFAHCMELLCTPETPPRPVSAPRRPPSPRWIRAQPSLPPPILLGILELHAQRAVSLFFTSARSARMTASGGPRAARRHRPRARPAP